MNWRCVRSTSLCVLAFLLCLALVVACSSKKNDGDDDDGGSSVLDPSTSECLGNLKADDDSIATVDEELVLHYADGALAVEHHYTPRNCAWTMDVSFEMTGGTLRIVEGMKAADALTGCGCCYDTSYSLPDVEAKAWTLVFVARNFNGESFSEETLVTEPVDFSAQTDYTFVIRELSCV